MGESHLGGHQSERKAGAGGSGGASQSGGGCGVVVVGEGEEETLRPDRFPDPLWPDFVVVSTYIAVIG